MRYPIRLLLVGLSLVGAMNQNGLSQSVEDSKHSKPSPTSTTVGPIWRTVNRRSTGNSQAEVSRTRFDANGLKLGNRPIHSFTRLSNQDSLSPRQIEMQWPIRIITLWTGERFVAQLVGSNSSKQLELVLGENRTSIALPLVREISMPNRIREFCFDPQHPQDRGWTQGQVETPIRSNLQNGEQQGLPTISKGLATFRSQSPLRTGEISMNLLWRRFAQKPPTSPGVAQPANQVLHFVFAGPRPDSNRVLSVKNGPDGELIVEAPDQHRMTTTKVQLKSDSLQVRFRFGTQNYLSINGQMAARSSKSIGQFRYARILVDNTPVGLGMTTLSEPLTIGDLKIVERTMISDNSDRVVLHNGDELFGTVQKVLPSSIEIESSKSTVVVGWHRIRTIQLSPSGTGTLAQSKAISGELARVRLRDIPGIDQGAASSLCLTLKSVGRSGLVAVHPQLGKLKLGWQNFHAIEPWGHCDVYQILRPTPVHLGKSTRLDFQMPQPSGTQTAVQFSLPKRPVNQILLQLQVVDLEPSGPDTLAARPRRDEVRSGHFTTEVWVNDKFNCGLNPFVSRLNPPNEPHRIELTISPENLFKGDNRISIRQKPSLANATVYDDCEIGPIALIIKH